MNCVVGVFSARSFVSLLAQQVVRLHSGGGGGGEGVDFSALKRKFLVKIFVFKHNLLFSGVSW